MKNYKFEELLHLILCTQRWVVDTIYFWYTIYLAANILQCCYLYNKQEKKMQGFLSVYLISNK